MRQMSIDPPSIADIVNELPAEERLILQVLQAIQHRIGYVPEDSLPVVAQLLNVSRAEVIGVLTFYHDLRRSPPARFTISVCMAEACQSVGAVELRSAIDDYVSQRVDTEVVSVYCLGNCALGPAVLLNGRLLGRVDENSLQQEFTAALGGTDET